MFDWMMTAEGWIAFLTLMALEVVLGIDNVVFISILAGKLPADQQPRARTIGLALAMLIRIALLFAISWVVRLTATLFSAVGQDFSGRDLIMIGGGLFLLAKATMEIHHKLEGDEEASATRVKPTFGAVILQILLLDAVFSLDSVITAVGMVDEIPIMVAAVVVAVGIMLVSAGAISRFVDQHPTVKMLALSFLLLIGMVLVADGFDQHIAKGYVYFALGFSVFVEMLNLRSKKARGTPVKLHGRVPGG